MVGFCHGGNIPASHDGDDDDDDNYVIMTMMTMMRMMTTTMIISVMFSPHIYSSHQESSVPCLEELQVNNLKVYNSQILVESTFESAINVDGDTFVQKINF